MAILQSYAAAGEIPESLREHYTEKEGRFVLQTDPPTEDVTGLKTALDSERRLRRDAESQVSTFKSKFEGIDPAEVGQMRERLESLKDKEIYDKEGLEALVGRRTQALQDDKARQIAARDRALEAAEAKYNELDTRWRTDRIQTAMTSDFIKAEVRDYAMEDAIGRGSKVFRDIDERGQPVAKNGDEIIYGKDGITPLTPHEWVVGLRTKGLAPHFWASSSGSGAPGGLMNGAGGKDYSKLPTIERITQWRADHPNG